MLLDCFDFCIESTTRDSAFRLQTDCWYLTLCAVNVRYLSVGHITRRAYRLNVIDTTPEPAVRVNLYIVQRGTTFCRTRQSSAIISLP
jgi:hypothetical protein